MALLKWKYNYWSCYFEPHMAVTDGPWRVGLKQPDLLAQLVFSPTYRLCWYCKSHILIGEDRGVRKKCSFSAQ